MQKGKTDVNQSIMDKNLSAEIFSEPVVAQELERMWRERREQVAEIARQMADRKPTALFFFGSGGSAAALYSGYYAALRYLKLPSLYVISPEIVSAQPALLNDKAVAIGASYSGKTMDTLAARDFLRQRRVALLAITRKAEGELGREAEWHLTYDSVALYSSPAFLTMLLVVELCRASGEWSAEVDELERALEDLPRLIRSIAEASHTLAVRLASEVNGKLVILSGGGTYALGHMMAFDMFGEYLKQYCAFIHYGEFRHGPLEVVGKGEPTMMFLMGNDRSRKFAHSALKFGQQHGARTIVFDHPLLDALVVYPSQLWLLYHLACRQGIDLDEYKYMHVTPYAEGDTYF
jgi:fructoselysine-6-P-deglycase FrlB-like protein